LMLPFGINELPHFQGGRSVAGHLGLAIALLERLGEGGEEDKDEG